MASFTDSLTQLKTILTDGLYNFCSEKFGKPMNVTITYRNKQEIVPADLPLAFITRPSTVPVGGLVGQLKKDHTVLLYVGFYCADKEKAATATIEIEELIERTLQANFNLNGTVESITVINSANDEGKFHPNYFQVIELKAAKYNE